MTPDTTVNEQIRADLLAAIAAAPDRTAQDLVEDCPSAVEQQQVYRQLNNLLRAGAITVSGEAPGTRGQRRKTYRLADPVAPPETTPAARMQAAEDPTDPEAALDTSAESPLSWDEHARLLEAISPTCTHCGTRLDAYDGFSPICERCRALMAEVETDVTQREPQPPDGYYASTLELRLEPESVDAACDGPITLTARADLGRGEVVLTTPGCTLGPDAWDHIARIAHQLTRTLEGLTHA